MHVNSVGSLREDAAPGTPAGRPDAGRPQPPSPERRRVILVVEDTPEDVEVIQRHLRRLSDVRYVIRTVPKGADGLAALRAAGVRGRRGRSARRFGGRGRPGERPPEAELHAEFHAELHDGLYELAGEREPRLVEREERIDCVLLDFHLPDMTALEFLDGLAAETVGDWRAAHAAREEDDAPPAAGPAPRLPVPVVILSGTANRLEPAVAALKRGALDYLAKGSITTVALHRAIEAAVERFDAARLLEEQREALARQNRALDAAAARTARLLGAATALAAAAGPAEVAAALVEAGVEALAADRGAVVLRAADDRELEVVDARGPDALPSRAGAADRAPHARPRLGADLADATRRATAAGDAVWEGAGAAVAVPLVVNGRHAGALGLAFPAPRAIGPEERAFLLTLTRVGAQALDRARMFAETQSARAEAEVARRRAEEANAAKSQFLATMSHELRTPLNAIRGYVDLIEAGVYGAVSRDQFEALGRVRRSESHLLGLINEILDFARLEARPPEYRRERVSMAAVVDDARAFVEPQLRAKALAFDATCDGDAAALADPDRVRQVVLNLLSNALKFTPAGGLVTLHCRARGDRVGARRVELEVADTGIGIPPDKLEAIFEPFVQLGRTLNAPASGTGLGLAISRQLARGMGGELVARSDGGRGARFTLSLPAY